MLFISTGIFDDKLHPQILSVVPTANPPLMDFYDEPEQRVPRLLVMYKDIIIISSNVTCSHHVIARTFSFGVKQQSLTHSYTYKLQDNLK